MEWAQILVIILSIFLAIFLLVGIVLVILLIKVTNQIKKVASSAERTMLQVEKAGSGIARLITPTLLLKTILRKTKNRKK